MGITNEGVERYVAGFLECCPRCFGARPARHLSLVDDFVLASGKCSVCDLLWADIFEWTHLTIDDGNGTAFAPLAVGYHLDGVGALVCVDGSHVIGVTRSGPVYAVARIEGERQAVDIIEHREFLSACRDFEGRVSEQPTQEDASEDHQD